MLYMIGGSPCSGKSTIASLLARQYQLLHIKLDDLIEEMADEEWRFYEEIFPYVKSYLIKNQNRPLLVEGAGLLPHLVKELECPTTSYPCLSPTADFQIKN